MAATWKGWVGLWKKPEKRGKTTKLLIMSDFNLLNLTHSPAVPSVNSPVASLASFPWPLVFHHIKVNAILLSLNCKKPPTVKSSHLPQCSLLCCAWPCHIHSISPQRWMNSCFPWPGYFRNSPSSQWIVWNPRGKEFLKKYIQWRSPPCIRFAVWSSKVIFYLLF